ncbi:MAG: single-stranded-DNA-specific exonuclease RecJ [Thermomicrobiales bacterium]
MSQKHTPSLSEMMRDAATWIEPEAIPRSFDLGPVHRDSLIAHLLYRRGIRTASAANDYLDTRQKPVPSASVIPNLTAAVDRVASAIDRAERIGIFGDYDVDGITSTALLTTALRLALDTVSILPILPERSEGYGLSERGIDRIADFGAKLMICVDCGSTDRENVAYARSRGLDVVILDHHQMSAASPVDGIVANPQLDSDSEFRILTGVGLTYLLVCALAARGYRIAPDGASETDYLDLVALGTVADVAPLMGLNRHLVRQGLHILRQTRRPGISALISESRLSQKGLEASHIAYQLAPRINAAGRLASASAALDLMLSTNGKTAMELAGHLNKLNLDRRGKQELAVADATRDILALPDWKTRGFVSVVSPDWEAGLIGVIAGRLCETLRCPVIVFRREGDTLTGSARSVKGFDIAESLRTLTNLLTRHGGHEQAAGLTLPTAHLDQFNKAMLELVAACGTDIPVARTIQIDADLDEAHLSQNTVRAISELEPFGQGNHQPILRVRNARIQRYSTMSDGKHLKLFVTAGSRHFEAIQWNAGWRSKEFVVTRTVDLAGRLDINEFNEQTRLQMILDDVRPA